MDIPESDFRLGEIRRITNPLYRRWEWDFTLRHIYARNTWSTLIQGFYLSSYERLEKFDIRRLREYPANWDFYNEGWRKADIKNDVPRGYVSRRSLCTLKELSWVILRSSGTFFDPHVPTTIKHGRSQFLFPTDQRDIYTLLMGPQPSIPRKPHWKSRVEVMFSTTPLSKLVTRKILSLWEPELDERMTHQELMARFVDHLPKWEMNCSSLCVGPIKWCFRCAYLANVRVNILASESRQTEDDVD